MKNSEQELLEMMQARYKRTKFVFFELTELKKMYGDDVVKDLNKLLKKGIVKRRQGVNGILVELIKTEA